MTDNGRGALAQKFLFFPTSLLEPMFAHADGPCAT